MEVIKNIAAIVGCVLSCISLLTLIIKPIRTKIINWVAEIADKSETASMLTEMQKQINCLHKQMQENAEENRKHNEEMQAKIDSIVKADKKSNEALKDIIRERIVSTYYCNLQTNKLHYEEWETVSELADSYFDLGGNHFVKSLMDKMSAWEIVQ